MADANINAGLGDSMEEDSVTLSEMEGSIENSNVGSTETGTDPSDIASGVLAEATGFRPLTVPARSTANRSIPRNRPVPRPRRPRAPRMPSYLPWVLGFGGVGLLGSFFGVRHYLRYRSRSCDTCRIDRVLLTEVQDDDFLNKPERIEEKIGSVDYDVWACLECEDVVKLRYGRWMTRYSKCPDCSYVTRFKITETVVHATTMNGGLVRVKEFCKHCDYQHIYTYSTPRIQKSSGSSSGGFSSGGSSGGGFSSGGGASGRW